MRIIIHAEPDDPYHNMAAEEYLLEHSDDDIFMLWRNEPAVIIGKNQNAWAEVNLPYTEENRIPVVRRLTGGGAVFHDPGNVNFTFITDARPGEGIDFTPFTGPILAALSSLGVEAAADGRNDILAGGAKISGNAQCVYRRRDGTPRLLHHGTLLFDADLSRLAAALRVRPEKIRAKGIASVRRRVTNLRDVPGFPREMDVEAFLFHLARCAGDRPDAYTAPLSRAETEGIRALAEEKYETWEWNFGRAGEHESEMFARFPFGCVSASFTARRGVITEIRIFGDFFGTEDVSRLEAALIGVPLRREALLSALSAPSCPLSACIAGAGPEDVAALLLGETEPALNTET